MLQILTNILQNSLQVVLLTGKLATGERGCGIGTRTFSNLFKSAINFGGGIDSFIYYTNA